MGSHRTGEGEPAPCKGQQREVYATHLSMMNCKGGTHMGCKQPVQSPFP